MSKEITHVVDGQEVTAKLLKGDKEGVDFCIEISAPCDECEMSLTLSYSDQDSDEVLALFTPERAKMILESMKKEVGLLPVE